MIKHISISNYALIKSLQLDLNKGFTTVTGETGAGKSILLGALGLTLGNRADSKVMADQTVKCVVEVLFDIKSLGLQSFFATNDLDYDAECLIRREITPSGKSRSFINDTPVRLDILKQLGERLIDIHSQHESVLMMNTGFQLQMLDAIGEHDTVLSAYQSSYKGYMSLLKKKDDMIAQLSENRDLDYLSFLHDELEKTQLIANEENDVEEELNVLRHAEDIQINLNEAVQALNNEGSAIDLIYNALRSVETIKEYLPEAEDLGNRLQATEIELRDIVAELEANAGKTNLDESRLVELESRWNGINHLFQKHRVNTTAELLEIQNDLSNKIKLATDSQVALAKIDREIEEQLDLVNSAGSTLSIARQQTARYLEEQANSYLKRLNMQQAQLKVDLSHTHNPTSSGIDDITFFFSANAGRDLQPLKKVASGGELSRVMLAMKAILAQTKSLPAIIFDEIDTGISGETAHRVADILTEMGDSMQVMAITHLPQIAARGKEHVLVEKHVVDGQTETTLSYLSPNNRVEEIARMLSGERTTDSAKKTAEELLQEQH